MSMKDMKLRNLELVFSSVNLNAHAACPSQFVHFEKTLRVRAYASSSRPEESTRSQMLTLLAVSYRYSENRLNS